MPEVCERGERERQSAGAPSLRRIAVFRLRRGGPPQMEERVPVTAHEGMWEESVRVRQSVLAALPTLSICGEMSRL